MTFGPFTEPYNHNDYSLQIHFFYKTKSKLSGLPTMMDNGKITL